MCQSGDKLYRNEKKAPATVIVAEADVQSIRCSRLVKFNVERWRCECDY